MQQIARIIAGKWSLAAARLAMLLFSFISPALAENDPRLLELNKLLKDKDKLELWWIIPQDTHWKKFMFLKFDDQLTQKFVDLLSKSEFSESAGNFNLLDISFEDADKRGQGYIVVRAMNEKSIFGLRFRAINVDKRSLEFVTITGMDPKNKSLSVKLNKDLDGVVVKSDFRSLLKDFRRNK